MRTKKSFWKRRHVLVTGGAGFIGFALARYLRNQGADVTILDIKKSLPGFATQADKRNLHYVHGSVTSAKTVASLLRRRNIETIFHLAAETIVGRALKNPAATLDTNIRGSWVLLECVRKNSTVKEIIVASSDKAYGSHARLPYRENAALAGLHPYDSSKSSADLISQMYAKVYGLPISVARCGNVYGGGDLNWSRLVPSAFHSIKNGKTLEIRSDGTPTRDYVYVDDITRAYCVLAENLQKKNLSGEAFNFGTNEPISVRDMLKLIGRAAKKPVPHKIMNSASYEICSQYLDSRKARQVLGWRPMVRRNIALQKTTQWYRRNHGSNTI